MMNKKELIPFEKISFFQKIKKFVSKIKKTKEPKTSLIDKENLWDLYQKAKQGTIDIRTVDPEIVKKFYVLINEEIKMKEKIRDNKLRILQSI